MEKSQQELRMNWCEDTLTALRELLPGVTDFGVIAWANSKCLITDAEWVALERYLLREDYR